MPNDVKKYASSYRRPDCRLPCAASLGGQIPARSSTWPTRPVNCQSSSEPETLPSWGKPCLRTTEGKTPWSRFPSVFLWSLARPIKTSGKALRTLLSRSGVQSAKKKEEAQELIREFAGNAKKKTRPEMPASNGSESKDPPPERP